MRSGFGPPESPSSASRERHVSGLSDGAASSATAACCLPSSSVCPAAMAPAAFGATSVTNRAPARLVAVAVAPDPSMCSFSCIARVVMPPVNAAGKLKRRQGTQVVDGRATRPLLWISQRPIPPRASAPRQAGLRLRELDPRVNALEERAVAPFYLRMMGANAPGCSRELWEPLVDVGKTLSLDHVQWLLRVGGWRPVVMGAWFSTRFTAAEIGADLQRAMRMSAGSLTALPLAAATAQMFGMDAVPDMMAYIESQTSEKSAPSDAVVAAGIAHLGSSEACSVHGPSSTGRPSWPCSRVGDRLGSDLTKRLWPQGRPTDRPIPPPEDRRRVGRGCQTLPRAR